MKTLTLLIFSGERFTIRSLLNDITKLNNLNLNVVVVEWSEKKTILRKKIKLYNSYKKKIKNFKVYFQKGNFEFKYQMFINKFNSRYILLIGDDDRINYKNFEKINKYLKFKFSGITLSFDNFKSDRDLKINQNKKESIDKIRSFDLFKDFHKIGYISCQIINVKYIRNILDKENKYLSKTQFPQNFLILKIIKKFKNWKILELSCIHNRVGNLKSYDKNKDDLLIRLKSEYSGYFIPVKKYFTNLKHSQLNNIYKNIFFKNILSWIFVCIKHHGKVKTFKYINEVRKILNEPFIIKLCMIFIYICPIFLLNILRIFRRMISLK